MLLIFYKRQLAGGKVSAQVSAVIEAETFDAGTVELPSQETWQKFIGAIQRGALGIRDMDVRVEVVRQ